MRKVLGEGSDNKAIQTAGIDGEGLQALRNYLMRVFRAESWELVPPKPEAVILRPAPTRRSR